MVPATQLHFYAIKSYKQLLNINNFIYILDGTGHENQWEILLRVLLGKENLKIKRENNDVMSDVVSVSELSNVIE